MKTEKAKLPKGHSYPLRPTVLEAALAEANIEIDTHFIRAPGSLFDAHFWPPNQNAPYERLYIRAGSVLRENAIEARLWAEAQMLPALVEWTTDILDKHVNSDLRCQEQYIGFRLP